jgi:hypothetical protein
MGHRLAGNFPGTVLATVTSASRAVAVQRQPVKLPAPSIREAFRQLALRAWRRGTAAVSARGYSRVRQVFEAGQSAAYSWRLLTMSKAPRAKCEPAPASQLLIFRYLSPTGPALPVTGTPSVRLGPARLRLVS